MTNVIYAFISYVHVLSDMRRRNKNSVCNRVKYKRLGTRIYRGKYDPVFAARRLYGHQIPNQWTYENMGGGRGGLSRGGFTRNSLTRHI